VSRIGVRGSKAPPRSPEGTRLTDNHHLHVVEGTLVESPAIGEGRLKRAALCEAPGSLTAVEQTGPQQPSRKVIILAGSRASLEGHLNIRSWEGKMVCSRHSLCRKSCGNSTILWGPPANRANAVLTAVRLHLRHQFPFRLEYALRTCSFVKYGFLNSAASDDLHDGSSSNCGTSIKVPLRRASNITCFAVWLTLAHTHQVSGHDKRLNYCGSQVPAWPVTRPRDLLCC
jgi:hypothetical protein